VTLINPPPCAAVAFCVRCGCVAELVALGWRCLNPQCGVVTDAEEAAEQTSDA
jgi:hypothetical protein